MRASVGTVIAACLIALVGANCGGDPAPQTATVAKPAKDAAAAPPVVNDSHPEPTRPTPPPPAVPAPTATPPAAPEPAPPAETPAPVVREPPSPPAPPKAEPAPPAPPQPEPQPEPVAPQQQPPQPDATTLPIAPSDAPYVGSGACQKCHFAQHKAWKKTPHARALDVLRPTPEAADPALRAKKVRFRIDPDADHATDRACVPCHTTGFGADLGWRSDPADEQATARNRGLAGVGCEACHGPGRVYSEFKAAEIGRDRNAKFPVETLVAQGLVVPDASTCRRCHSSASPTYDGTPLDFATEKARIHPSK